MHEPLPPGATSAAVPMFATPMFATPLARAAAALSVALSACGHAPPPATSPPRAEVEEPAPPPAPAPDAASAADARLAAAVRRELEVDPAVDAEAIEVRARDGIVELAGEVPHLLMSDAALARAEMVHGVRAVIDRTAVPRTARSDALVRAQVEEALRASEAGIRRPVVRVVDGVVTLHGTAASFAHARLAERVARGVRGVREVIDRTELRHAPRPDDDILADVRLALRADRWVDEWLLEVEVDSAIVSLRGVQPTAAAKRRAIDAVWVPGVIAVDAALVEVDPDLGPERRRPPAGYAYPGDEEIADMVRAALARDPQTGRARLAARAQGGIVTLEGSAPSLAAREAASHAAEAVSGVWRVVDHVTVRSTPAPSDEELSREAEQAIARAAAVDEATVSARVDRGVVTLVGHVEAPHARLAAEEVVARIRGVRAVENEIEVPARAAPPLADLELEQNVIAHLEGHPYVDPASVQVTVAGGQVLLRGRVDDWRAHREAVRAAHEAGATSVIDDLEVLEHGARAP